MAIKKAIPVIDLFAGPGGLGEGFAALGRFENGPVFDTRLSIEKNPYAYQTLLLRSFFRQFPHGQAPIEYYEYLRNGNNTDTELESLLSSFPSEAEQAMKRVIRAELGRDNELIHARIEKALRKRKNWVLIGGPPCQAYSIVGRSRNKGNPEYDAAKDSRQLLYQEYLKILAEFLPAIFIMENVKGLLSATLNNVLIFEQMLKDLAEPREALVTAGRLFAGNRVSTRYRIFSLVKPESDGQRDLRDFIVCMEKYGIPQARHRVILLGIREDIKNLTLPKLEESKEGLIPALSVLNDLPPLRSGLSQEEDSPENWFSRVKESVSSNWIGSVSEKAGRNVEKAIYETVRNLKLPALDRGAEFIFWDRSVEYEKQWFHDPHLKGVCNHKTRIHIAQDLHRYLYAACYASELGVSPDIRNFPDNLLPHHNNVSKAINEGHFDDRFHVISQKGPSTTVTSHLAKDGHYFIHPDKSQCRSITAREAARLQTFPDNYFFRGTRTQQYIQIGNAVPPLLACKIAEIVRKILENSGII